MVWKRFDASSFNTYNIYSCMYNENHLVQFIMTSYISQLEVFPTLY